ncbi:MAG: beta-lactamase family protein [Sphingopyxis sp.]|nr:beta-lactamase family protein [Sphingopyxis sp.]
MVSRRALFGWAAGAATLAAIPAPLRAMVQGAERYPALRAFLEAFVTSRRLPGVIAAVGRGDAPMDSIAAGVIANGSDRMVDADTLWRLYSQTKPVTPRFANMRVLARPDAPLDETVPLARPITVRHILTHTAGLGYGLGRTTPIDRAWSERRLTPGQISKMPLPGFPTGSTLGPLSAWADAVPDLPLVAQPGTRWFYSASLDLAGRLIEVVSGKTFDQYLQEVIFGPLGMADTSFRVTDAQLPRLVTNYAPFGGALIPIDPAATSIYRDAPSFPFGGAGLVSSARDYDKFLAMLLGEGALGRTRILSSETARLAMSNLLPDGVDTANTFVDGQGFGAGGRVTLASSPGGAGGFGWGGAAGTVGFVHRGLGLRFGGYANYMPSEAYDFQRRIIEVALSDLTGGARSPA